MAIELDAATREELVTEIQRYFNDELRQQIGSFDARFLLDFFARRAGCHFYNKGLTDAFQALEARMAEASELIYELEQQPDAD